MKKILAMAMSLALALSFFSCSDNNDDNTDNNGTKKEVTTPKTTETKGTVSTETVKVTKNETTGQEVRTAVLETAEGGVYEFTEDTDSAQAYISARVSATIGHGTWKYKEKNVVKYTGTYKGDISKIGTEETKLELKVETTTNSIDEEVRVLEEKTFELPITTTEFKATIPEIISGVLDLRIKGGNVATGEDKCYDPSQTVEWGAKTDIVVTSDHVKATVYENGIFFEVTRPDGEGYEKEGLGYVAVYKVEDDDDWTTREDLNKEYEYTPVSFEEAYEYDKDRDLWILKYGYASFQTGTDEFGNPEYTQYKETEKDPLHRTGFWPVCIKDKPITFSVQIETNNPEKWRQFTYHERLTVTPKGGIGEIDYANRNAKKWLISGMKNGKPVIKFNKEDLVLPNVKDIRTTANFFAGNLDWDTNGATIWCNWAGKDGAVYEIEISDEEAKNIIQSVKRCGKDEFAYEFQYEFTIPGCGDNTSWRASTFWSDLMKIN